MKVMMIEPLDDGGIAHYAYNLSSFLAQKGTEMTLYTGRMFEFTGRKPRLMIYPKMFKGAAEAVRRFPWISRETKIPSYIRRGLKLIEYPINTLESMWISKRTNTDVVHFQTVNLTELIMILAFKCIGSKVVFTIHNVNPRHGKLLLFHKWLYRFMYCLCDSLIIHSENGRNEVIKLFKVDPNKISVIPHGDYKFFVPADNIPTKEAKANLGIAPEWKTLLFFGAIRPNKGLDNILRALPLIRENILNVKLLVVGEPCEHYKRYKEIIEKECLQENIFEKLDYVPNDTVSKYFFASDLVVLPYNEITQSGVLQIAYAFGKPVVATAIGGFNEAIEEGKNGFLVPPGNIEALADRIIDILKNEEKMQKMGAYSRHLSDTKYSWDSIAMQTLNIYRDLLS